MSGCKHATFVPKVTTNRLTSREYGLSVLMASVTATCAECGRRFTWRAPRGLSTEGAGTNADGTVLRIPIDYPVTEEVEPDNSDEDEPTVH